MPEPYLPPEPRPENPIVLPVYIERQERDTSDEPGPASQLVNVTITRRNNDPFGKPPFATLEDARDNPDLVHGTLKDAYRAPENFPLSGTWYVVEIESSNPMPGYLTRCPGIVTGKNTEPPEAHDD